MKTKGITLSNQRTFDRCFRNNYQALCYFASQLLNNEAESEDVVQEVFVKILNASRTFESDDHVRNYLYTAVRNTCSDRLAKRPEEQLNQTHTALSDENTMEALMVKTEVVRLIADAISQLPQRQQEVFTMAYQQGYSNAEIAELLDISENTVKVQKQRAKKALRQQLKDVYPLALMLLAEKFL